MLRILRDEDQNALSADATEFRESDPSRYPIINLARSVSRGRSSLTTGQTFRSGASVSAVEAAITAHVTHGNGVHRPMRSASPILQSQQPARGSYESPSPDDDDSDEVSFWGGSPRPSERLRSPSSQRNNYSVGASDVGTASSDDNDETSDNQDDNMSGGTGSEESDELDLVGHV